MKKIFALILGVCLLPSIVLAYTVQEGDYLSKIGQKFGLSWQEIWEKNPQIENPDLIYIGQELNIEDEVLGGTLPVAGTNYYLAGSGITSSATSITLQSLTIPQTGYELVDGDFSSTFYITLEPGNQKRQEIASCTTVTQNANDTATLSGCSRGLVPFYPYTASTTYAFSHAGGTTVIFSDAPQLFNEYPSKTNDEIITGDWAFPTPLSSNTDAPATVEYVNNTTAQGVATSTETTFGGGELATQIEMASSTYSADDPKIIYSRYTTSTPDVRGLYIPVSENDGYLNQDWLDLTETYSWTGANTHAGQETFSATTTFTTTTMDALEVTSSTITNLDLGGKSANTLVDGSNADALHTHNYGQIQFTTSTITLYSSTPEVTIWDETIAGGTLGTEGLLDFDLIITSFNLLAATDRDNVVFRLKYGGTTMATCSITNDVGNVSSLTGNITGFVMGAGTTASQVGVLKVRATSHGGFSSAVGGTLTVFDCQAQGTAAVDSTSNQTWSITIDYELAVSGNEINLGYGWLRSTGK